jgi:hypothetical protein
MIDWISTVITNYGFLTWIGAICGHVLSLYATDFPGTKPFFEKVSPGKSETFYYRMDFCILPIIGALLAYSLLDPNSIKASIFAGLSWSGTLTALLKKASDQKSLPNE